MGIELSYLIPIKIRAPLIFAHLAYAKKLKGASLRSLVVRKLKEEEKMPRMNENTANLHRNKGARKLKGRKIRGCAIIKGAKIKGAHFKGARILIGLRYSRTVLPDNTLFYDNGDFVHRGSTFLYFFQK